MLWSAASIPGRPRVMLVDASGNREGWEREFCQRLFRTMERRGLAMSGHGPVEPEWRTEVHLLPNSASLEAGTGKWPWPWEDGGVNCLLWFAHVPELDGHWQRLKLQAPRSVLLAVVSWDSYDPKVSNEILEGQDTFAPLAVAQQSPLTPREAGLFVLKFFTELELHSTDSITGKIVWFSHSKARELLRRRRLEGRVGVRC